MSAQAHLSVAHSCMYLCTTLDHVILRVHCLWESWAHWPVPILLLQDRWQYQIISKFHQYFGRNPVVLSRTGSVTYTIRGNKTSLQSAAAQSIRRKITRPSQKLNCGLWSALWQKFVQIIKRIYYEASPDVSVNQQSGNVTSFSLTTVILKARVRAKDAATMMFSHKMFSTQRQV